MVLNKISPNGKIRNMMRSTCILALFTLAIPGSTFAASKEQQEMQRDIAQLQDQVRLLQSGFDQKMATLQTLVEQALDAGNKANTNVSVLTASVTQTLTRELSDSLRPVAGLSSRVDNLGNDTSEIKNSLTDLNTQMNRLQQQLTDVSNAIKVIQSPAAAPPPSNTNADAGPAASEPVLRRSRRPLKSYTAMPRTILPAAKRILRRRTGPSFSAIIRTIRLPRRRSFSSARFTCPR